MGYYVNPENESKESFLEREGILIDSITWDDVPRDCFPVVLMNNGLFTAAGIAYSEKELKEFTNPSDTRPRKIYVVEIEKLLLASDISRLLKT